MIELRHQIQLTVPNRDRWSHIIDIRESLRRLRSVMSVCFGGAIVGFGVGEWTNEEGTRYPEKLRLLSSSFDDAAAKNVSTVVKEFWRIGFIDLRQEFLSIEINGTRLLVEQSTQDWIALTQWIEKEFAVTARSRDDGDDGRLEVS